MNRLRARIGPLWPYVVLVAVPTAAFVLPDLLGGRLLMTGDNLQQNYPLHVLVGSMLRHGELPLWNPYIFSGTPLLADFNAGVFYPLMGFFVAMPDRAAWLATEVVVYSGIAVGMYVFLRALAFSTLACLLGAATFTFAGPVLSQVNHVDMAEGFLAIPWMLLAVLHIVRDGRWRWSILLGVAFATVVLAGAPEAMLDEAVLVMAYAAMSAGIDRERWWRVLTRGATGAALALSLAAIQWLPGLDAIRASQRGSGVAAAAGSFPAPFGIFALVPYINGGYGNFGQAPFFSHYNLPEVQIYLGVLPVIALITLLHPRWPSRLLPRDRLTWYIVGLVGLVLALGSNTPLEHLFNLVPLYGHQRLQSRNMITVATAVCVLFAGYVDRTRTPRARDPMTRYERVMALVPMAVVAGLVIWALAAPGSLVHTFAGASPTPAITSTVRQATAVSLVFCTGAAVLVWVRPRFDPRRWTWLAVVFVALDIGLIAATSQLAEVPPNDLLAGTTPVQRLMATHLVPGGRLVNYDPQKYASYPGSPQGVPDLNIIPRLPSISGYASIVNQTYESLTHTHEQDNLDIGALTAGSLDRLDLREVVSVPQYFLVPLRVAPRSIDDIRPMSERFGTDPVLHRGYQSGLDHMASPFDPGPRPALGAGQSASWFFGETLSPATGTLVLTRPAVGGTHIRFGTLTPTGSTRWGASVDVTSGATRVTARLPRGAAVGLSVRVSGPLPALRGVIGVHDRSYELSGDLSSVIVPGPWQVAGFSQGYAVFTMRRPPVQVEALSPTGRRLPVTILSSTAKSQRVRVIAPGTATLVRSVAWDSGWRASVSVGHRPVRDVPVHSFDLVQQVRVPAGRDVVTFHYRPRHFLAASVLSLGACALLIALLVLWLFRRRRAVHTASGDAAGPEGAGPEGADPQVAQQ